MRTARRKTSKRYHTILAGTLPLGGTTEIVRDDLYVRVDWDEQNPRYLDASIPRMGDAVQPLDKYIVSIQKRSIDIPHNTFKQQADLYLAFVGIFCHLKNDQATLQSTWQQHKETNTELQTTKQCQCPPPHQIPAASAILQDPRLFHSLLRCLNSPATEMDTSPASVDHGRPNSQPSAGQIGRKRSLSCGSADNDAPPNKSMKMHNSPKPNMKFKMQQQHPQDVHGEGKKLNYNIRIAAATVLYAGLQHVDHWPAPLVYAYAEDCFGPRAWVDDKRCTLLVTNLALAHESATTSSSDKQHCELLQQEGDDISLFYEQFTFPHHDGDLDDNQEKDSPLAFPTIAQKAMACTSSTVSTASIKSQDVNGSNNARNSNDGMVASTDGDSSDSGEEEVLMEVSTGTLATTELKRTMPSSNTDSFKESSKQVFRSKSSANVGDDSSSSGEEDMEVMEMISFVDGESSGQNNPTSKPQSPPKPSYPFHQIFLNLKRVRQRYFGRNFYHAQRAISDSLSHRLDVKSKQNSKLLSNLPTFAPVPEVRRLIARHLERWMQSPALSGLARTLFAATVRQMRHVDPPLSADIDAIDYILSMRLKANQLNAHIENVTTIAKNIPTASVSHHIFLRLLREELASIDSARQGSRASPSEHLRMVSAVSTALSSSLISDGIAGALLTLLANPIDQNVTNKTIMTKQERRVLVTKLREMIQRVASVLGPSHFNGCQLVESLLSFDVDPASWSIDDEEDKARLMFECITLLVPSPVNPSENQIRQSKTNQRKGIRDVENVVDKPSLCKSLTMARKLMLSWCCTDYAPLVEAKERKEALASASTTFHRGSKEAKVLSLGAGTPDYQSVLDAKSGKDHESLSLNVMRCVLFLVDPESPILYSFLYPDHSQGTVDQNWYEERSRIQKCCEYGASLDDEMIWIILKSAALVDAKISPKIALSLIEHLVQCCRSDRIASSRVSDPKLVWALYNLVEYKPSIPHLLSSSKLDNDPFHVYAESDENKTFHNDKHEECSQPKETNFPRLAYPAMWWRATVVALVMCSTSPQEIGSVMWSEHPTLRALIKMVTSNRYRFPTIDCDQQRRDEMKSLESELRDEELKIAEILFFPIAKDKGNGKKIEDTLNFRGSRISARQREKQEKTLRLQRQKEAAKALAEANQRKRRLRTAQKSIMLLDPQRAARKPPRQSVDLILSVEKMFDLEKLFQKSVHPDFLLMTIGETSRHSIERAYDWLIPVISSVPGIISRLPSSASCFLLLRAYGAEGEKSSELRQLSSPLLTHVSDSLAGKFGESDAVRAADLLLADVADQAPDRRRCAWKVLQEALNNCTDNATDTSFATGKGSWLFSMLQLEYAQAFINDSIKYISRALAFERGTVLRVLVLALKEYIGFAKNKGAWNFAAIMYTLISSRHNVCFDALDRFPDFRSLAVNVIYAEFEMYRSKIVDKEVPETNLSVRITPFTIDQRGASESENKNGSSQSFVVPSDLLHAICVVLSNWNETDGELPIDTESKASIYAMTELLIYNCDHVDASDSDGDANGVASATFTCSGKKAVSVEQWVLLAKSRCDFIARRAALSAPTIILPRLLLCSGLPRSPLLTMIDRLGKLGDHATDQSKVFNQLLVPSATTDWGVGYLGNRREIARKLLGRLSAYLRIKQDILDSRDKEMSTTFLQWLSRECHHGQSKSRKSRLKKNSKTINSKYLANVSSAACILSQMTEVQPLQSLQTKLSFESIELPITPKIKQEKPAESAQALGHTKGDIESLVGNYCQTNRFSVMDVWLQSLYEDYTLQPRMNRKVGMTTSTTQTDIVRISVLLLEAHLKHPIQHDCLTRIVLKWVPLLTQSGGCKSLWEVLFDSLWDTCPSQEVWDQVLSRCVLFWRQNHVSACQCWILTEGLEDSDLSSARLVRFLALTSAQHSVHIRAFSNKFDLEHCALAGGEGSVSAGVSHALECMKQDAELSESINIDARDDFPDWLLLLLLVARRGKKQMETVIEMILDKTPEEKGELRRLMSSTLLRLYAYYPVSVKLGNAKLRSLLVEATETLAISWVDWRSPLDEQLRGMIVSLNANPHQRLVQSLGEISKGHPLLVMRKLPMLADMLDRDGAHSTMQSGVTETRRGRVQAEDWIDGSQAKFGGKVVKVVIRHWGYSFSEPLWLSVLEVLLMTPREVLFVCGLRMGLVDVLNTYIRLVYLQSQLQNRDKAARLKGRLKDLLCAFQGANAEAWNAWLNRQLPGLQNQGSTKDIVSSCSLLTLAQPVLLS